MLKENWQSLHKEQLKKLATIEGWDVKQSDCGDLCIEGVFIVFQNCDMSQEEIDTKERDYGNMVWIFQFKKNFIDQCNKPVFYYSGQTLYDMNNKMIESISMFDEEINAIMVEEDLNIFSWDENDIRLPGVIVEHMEPIYNAYQQIVKLVF